MIFLESISHVGRQLPMASAARSLLTQTAHCRRAVMKRSGHGPRCSHFSVDSTSTSASTSTSPTHFAPPTESEKSQWGFSSASLFRQIGVDMDAKPKHPDKRPQVAMIGPGLRRVHIEGEDVVLSPSICLFQDYVKPADLFVFDRHDPSQLLETSSSYMFAPRAAEVMNPSTSASSRVHSAWVYESAGQSFNIQPVPLHVRHQPSLHNISAHTLDITAIDNAFADTYREKFDGLVMTHVMWQAFLGSLHTPNLHERRVQALTTLLELVDPNGGSLYLDRYSAMCLIPPFNRFANKGESECFLTGIYPDSDHVKQTIQTSLTHSQGNVKNAETLTAQWYTFNYGFDSSKPESTRYVFDAIQSTLAPHFERNYSFSISSFGGKKNSIHIKISRSV